jgi:hypothetical protein
MWRIRGGVLDRITSTDRTQKRKERETIQLACGQKRGKEDNEDENQENGKQIGCAEAFCLVISNGLDNASPTLRRGMEKNEKNEVV